MTKTILITGSTDGIGLEAAKRLAADGHEILLHGRNPEKLQNAERAVRAQHGGGRVEQFLADLSLPADVVALAHEVSRNHDRLDVLINNAGVFRTPEPITAGGLDVRFAVNTIAPYVLVRELLPLFGPGGRVVNLSSAAQAPVDPRALAGETRLSGQDAYAQSKLALTMWSRQMALDLGPAGPVIIAVNPGSLLATKMVKEGYGIAGKDIGIGSGILAAAAVDPEFAQASGKYFDNDAGRFASPHPDALDPAKTQAITRLIDSLLDSDR